MHRHRRPGWRRCRPFSDIEAMHRQSAQIVRTELLTPGSVKQRITAPTRALAVRKHARRRAIRGTCEPAAVGGTPEDPGTGQET
jgi:hypothetical protein